MIALEEFTASKYPFGNEQGRKVYDKLREFVSSQTDQDVFEISLKGIEATDASFPRESVVALAKSLKGEIWFYLTGFASDDLKDNWFYAAQAKEQPLVVWSDNGYELIGKKLTGAAKTLFEYIFDHGSVTTASVARDLDITVQNASTRLKKLANEGLIMRQLDTASSGGKEFIYSSIK